MAQVDGGEANTGNLYNVGDWRANLRYLAPLEATRHRNCSMYNKWVRTELSNYFMNEGQLDWLMDQM